MSTSTNIIISGGGTGGHIYPAISIANKLKEKYPEASILFVGAKGRMEMEKVPQAGYPIKGLWITGIQRKISVKNLLFPFKLLSSICKAYTIIKKHKPKIVIGTGGFASGPTLWVASLLKIKTLIQEQNSYPGITNKLLSKKANKICVAYDGLERFFPKGKIVKTGNPVRQDLLKIDEKREEAISFFKLNKQKKTLVVLGGSLGARAINELLRSNIDWLLEQNVQIIWQTGKLYEQEFKKYDEYEDVQTYAFLNRMDLTYAAADFIISRAGASSISELCIVGKPVLFIPSPNVAEDHQTKNAQAIVAKKGALLLKQSEIEKFKDVFSEILNDRDLRLKMSNNIKGMALPNATENIVSEIEKIM